MKELDKASVIIKSGFKTFSAKKELGWKMRSHFKVVRGVPSMWDMSLQISVVQCLFCAYTAKGLRKTIFLEGQGLLNGPEIYLGNPKVRERIIWRKIREKIRSMICNNVN